MSALLIVFLGAIALLFAGINRPEKALKWPAVGILLLAAATAFANWDWVSWLELPDTMMAYSSMDQMYVALICLVAALAIAVFEGLESLGSDRLGLMMLSLSGGIMIIGQENLVMLFLGIEVLSIPLYVLAGSDKRNLFGNEAAIKYFLMGAFSTAILLLGSAFLYGSTGTLVLSTMTNKASMYAHFGVYPPMLTAGLILLGIGLLFKISAVPFHFWAPDVYEGSPARSTAFMATVVKIAGFSALARVALAFEPMVLWFQSSVAIIAVLSILLGNLLALVQSSPKRMLAYSSIAHAGYMMLALTLVGQAAFSVESILFLYLASYSLASIAAFAWVEWASERSGKVDFSMFQGLGQNPWVSVNLVLVFLSLAGIPLTAGFAGKYYLFSAAFEIAPWAVGLALLGSFLSIAYYFRAFQQAWSQQENQESISIPVGFAVISALILLVGCAPMWFLP
ncbi:MAG: NADH-quinone oxidoreductase subunit N [Bacteroidia bacterium]